MFTAKQVKYMNDLGLNFDFKNLSDNDLVEIEDIISQKLQKSGFDKNNNVTPDGKICESILDNLS